MQICSLSTIAREYLALRSVGSLPFKDLILSASEKSSGSQDQSWKIPGLLHEYIKENHNASQLEAIHVGSFLNYIFIQIPDLHKSYHTSPSCSASLRACLY